jgi:hypothetical protein
VAPPKLGRPDTTSLAVACGWFDVWLATEPVGDAVPHDAALAAIATSRDWSMLNEIADQGGWSEAIWGLADHGLHLDVTNGATATTDGWRIPMAVRDHVTCDGIVQPLWERDVASGDRHRS